MDRTYRIRVTDMADVEIMIVVVKAQAVEEAVSRVRALMAPIGPFNLLLL